MAIYKKRESHSYHNYKEKLQKQLKTNKKLQKQLKTNKKELKRLQNQISARKKQIAELQTTRYWLYYKTKNIIYRIKRKMI